jgi:hypothetical protein
MFACRFDVLRLGYLMKCQEMMTHISCATADTVNTESFANRRQSDIGIIGLQFIQTNLTIEMIAIQSLIRIFMQITKIIPDNR